jgi:Uma2 family endonuclease
MGTAQLVYMTVADYLAGEALLGPRHEYVNGEIFAMAGASKAHGTLALNFAMALRVHLRGKPCRTWTSDMKVEVQAANAYYYPDVVVTLRG